MSRIVYALVLLSSLTASAQTVTLSQSGYLLGANDQPLQSASTDMRFRLFDAAVNGNQLWDSGSTPCGVAVQSGYYACSSATRAEARSPRAPRRPTPCAGWRSPWAP